MCIFALRKRKVCGGLKRGGRRREREKGDGKKTQNKFGGEKKVHIFAPR
jgi:hypothetical protein